MSIINDALKKTQRKMQSKDKAKGKTTKTKKTQAEIRSTFTFLKYGALTLVFIAFFAAIGLPMYYHYNGSISYKEVMRQHLANLPAPTKTSNHRLKHVKAPSNLILKGTMLEGKKRVAFINHQTYKIGDTIDGYKITNITMYKVILKNAKGEIQVSTMSG